MRANPVNAKNKITEIRNFFECLKKDKINLTDPSVATKVAMALMVRENGGIVLTPDYIQAQIVKGLAHYG